MKKNWEIKRFSAKGFKCYVMGCGRKWKQSNERQLFWIKAFHTAAIRQPSAALPKVLVVCRTWLTSRPPLSRVSSTGFPQLRIPFLIYFSMSSSFEPYAWKCDKADKKRIPTGSRWYPKHHVISTAGLCAWCTAPRQGGSLPTSKEIGFKIHYLSCFLFQKIHNSSPSLFFSKTRLLNILRGTRPRDAKYTTGGQEGPCGRAVERRVKLLLAKVPSTLSPLLQDTWWSLKFNTNSTQWANNVTGLMSFSRLAMKSALRTCSSSIVSRSTSTLLPALRLKLKVKVLKNLKNTKKFNRN